jgi:hypothetical protein
MPSRSIVIVVIIVGSKATRLRVDSHFAGLPIQGSGRFDVSAVARDDDVRPSIGLQFLADLLCGDGLVARNESGRGRRLRICDHEACGCGEQRTDSLLSPS